MSLDGPRASVPHADEREGVGRRGGARGAAGRASKERVQALGRPGAAADEEHGADEHADHVPEEPIRLDLEDELVAPRGPRASGHGALEEDVLRAGGREGTEIVAPDDALGGPTERGGVQGPGMP